MDKEQEKWAIFWCELLSPLIFGQIDEQATNRFLKNLAQKPTRFPDGRIKKPSLSTLRRKLNRFRQGGFDALERQKRCDQGQPRSVSFEVIAKAIELKKEQPYRSSKVINRFLQSMYATTVPPRHALPTPESRRRHPHQAGRYQNEGPQTLDPGAHP